MSYNYRDRCKRGKCTHCASNALPGRPRCQRHSVASLEYVRKFRLKVKESIEIATDLFLPLIWELNNGHTEVRSLRRF
jgi:hypothetical protein